MGSVFKTFSEQPKRSIQQIQNQCSGSPIKTIATEKEFKEFEIDNFHQQCHSTQTASITCHKVASQASFSERRQQEKFCQKVYIDALATQAGIEPKTIVISSLTKPNSLQSCRSNCRSLKIIKNENKRIGQKLCQLRDDRFRTRNNYLAKTYLCLHGLLLEAQDTLTQLNKLHEDDINVKENKNRYPLADLSWYRFSLAGSVVPATMSAAVVSNLSGTLVSACYFLAQHCKAYSHSFRLYAASSLILLLCYLTTLSTAAGAQLEAAALEKHPIHSIDWSKFDESSSDKEILDLLLEKKRYDKRLLPPVNDEDFCCGLKSPDMASNQNARRPHNRGW